MIEEMRRSPLFDARRLASAFVLASLIGLLDLAFMHLLGIETISQLAMATLTHGLGLYLGFTIIAMFGTDVRL